MKSGSVMPSKEFSITFGLKINNDAATSATSFRKNFLIFYDASSRHYHYNILHLFELILHKCLSFLHNKSYQILV